MKDSKIQRKDFDFRFSGHGHYKVTYRSPVTGKEWSRVTDNMPLVDATRNEERPLKKDLEHLRRIVKNL